MLGDVETTPETRPIAPGPLGVLQQFLNSGHLGSEVRLPDGMIETVRERAHAGNHQATIAKDLGIGRMLVAAISRGAPANDELATAEAAAEWLSAQGLLQSLDAFAEADRERLIAFRELLRELAVDNTHGTHNAVLLRELDAVAAAAPLTAHFASPAEITLEPAPGGASAAVGRLLIILYDAIREGSWRRLKRCPGMGCPFTFFDSSRNRTATWCSMSVCGNRAKVRNYQERRRTARAVK